MKKASLLIIVLFALTNVVNAQNYEQNSYLDEKLREIIKEKLKPVNGLQHEEEIGQLQQLGTNISSENEMQVAKSLSAESEVHAAINPTDSSNIVLCPIKYSSQGLVLPIYYTKDFGQTWNLSSFVPFPKDSRAKVVGGGDPVFTFDSNGRLYFSWIHLYYTKTITDTMYWGLFWVYSDDGGITWIRPQNDIIGLSTGNYYQQRYDEIYDKQWMAVDLSNSVYQNTVYITYYKVQMTPRTERIVLKKKRSTSNAFDSLDVSISDSTFINVQFTNITIDAHGHVHIIFWGSKDGTTFGVWHSVSTNGGDNFSAPNLISTAQKLTGIVGVKTSRLYPCTQLASDPVNSNLYVTWTSTGTTSPGNTGADIYFSRSTDEGLNWSEPIIVNNDDKTGEAKDQFYSSIAVNKQGVVALSWYDGRHSTTKNANMDIRYFFTKSKNGGLSFGDNFSVTSMPTDFRTVGYKNNSFGIGEYTQILISNTYAIPVWADGRTGDGNLDIYVAFVSLDTNYLGVNEITVVSEKIRLEKMFPNPASDELNLNIYLNNTTDLNISLYDMQGREVKKIKKSTLSKGIHLLTLQLTDLNAGKYVMLIESDFGYISRSFSIIRKFK